ncbi:hypothetical protein PHLGIDRAFT_168863 [Phlebiopsis gigantea 11061_1 CR5-6]|uniref:C2H2-type domain-containing protein n=1 Tax=Phlebiopsis gigantea (strain 11061_1 CR5-6) TaxID=745531 RepID=A0A0C3PGX1_PHLG1|nr:hypothetical protein PHLGIDRAFT_168863 [Phlebiopsis gigantea 11061_1 CR5-6]
MSSLTTALIRIGAWESGMLTGGYLDGISHVASVAEFCDAISSDNAKATTVGSRPPRAAVSTTDLESSSSTSEPCPELTTDSRSDTISSSSSSLLTPTSECGSVFEGEDRPTIAFQGAFRKSSSSSTSTSARREHHEEGDEEDEDKDTSLERPTKRRKVTQKTTSSRSVKYRCSICGKSDRTRWDADRHAKTHLPDNEKPFQCRCGHSSVQESNFKLHQISHGH